MHLTEWANLYVILGSSSAALIGLQFVVITLISDTRASRSSGAISAFATPTVVHFTVALLMSTIMSVPWQSLSSTALALLVSGMAGSIYTAIIFRRARSQ